MLRNFDYARCFRDTEGLRFSFACNIGARTSELVSIVSPYNYDLNVTRVSWGTELARVF